MTLPPPKKKWRHYHQRKNMNFAILPWLACTILAANTNKGNDIHLQKCVPWPKFLSLYVLYTLQVCEHTQARMVEKIGLWVLWWTIQQIWSGTCIKLSYCGGINSPEFSILISWDKITKIEDLNHSNVAHELQAEKILKLFQSSVITVFTFSFSPEPLDQFYQTSHKACVVRVYKSVQMKDHLFFTE